MNRSEAQSNLVLIALDSRDADIWRTEHPELADAVRVALAGKGFDGLIATAVIFTEDATRHPNFARTRGLAERAVLKLAPARGWVAWDTFFEVSVAPHLDAIRGHILEAGRRMEHGGFVQKFTLGVL